MRIVLDLCSLLVGALTLWRLLDPPTPPRRRRRARPKRLRLVKR